MEGRPVRNSGDSECSNEGAEGESKEVGSSGSSSSSTAAQLSTKGGQAMELRSEGDSHEGKGGDTRPSAEERSAEWTPRSTTNHVGLDADSGGGGGGLFGDDDDDPDAGENLYDPSSSSGFLFGLPRRTQGSADMGDEAERVRRTEGSWTGRGESRYEGETDGDGKATGGYPGTKAVESFENTRGGGRRASLEESMRDSGAQESSGFKTTEGGASAEFERGGSGGDKHRETQQDEMRAPDRLDYSRRAASDWTASLSTDVTGGGGGDAGGREAVGRKLLVSKDVLQTQVYPDPGNRFVCVKFPPTVKVDRQGASRTWSDNSKPTGGETIRWTKRVSSDGSGEQSEVVEGNCNLVEWDDGSFTLFIGSQPFDCQIRKDVTHFFEDSHDDIKPLHGTAEERYQFVSSSYKLLRRTADRTPNRSSKQTGRARQKTKLTSLEEAAAAQQDIRDAMENEREATRMRRKQRDLDRDKGITRAFLENDSSPHEDEGAGSLSRIKERFGISKKRR